MTCSTDKEHISGNGKRKHIKGSGLKTTCTVTVSTLGLTEENIQVILSMILKMEKEYLSGQMVENILAAGQKINNMAQELISKTEKAKMEYG